MKAKAEFQRDRLTIRGHVWGRTDTPRDAVILSHGFLANEQTCFHYAEVLESLGYLAVTYDFCGGGLGSRSDGRSQDMTVYTEKDDLMAVIRGVQEQFKPKSISLMGCSQGGLVSAMTAAAIPEEIRKLVLFYPALCIPDDARKGRMMFYRFDPQNIPEILGRLPMKLGGEYARTVIDKDPCEMIKGYPGPVLYIHGTEDDIVNISYARKAKDVYDHCEYREIEGAGHGFRGADDKLACTYLSAFMTAE